MKLIKLLSLFLLIVIAVIAASYFLGGANIEPLIKPLTEKPQKKDPLAIVAAGDTTCDYLSKELYECKDGAVVTNAKKENPKYVLLLGDLQYGGGSLDQFNEFFALTWGTFGDKLKPTLGNHEYETENAQGYFDFFDGVEPYYSFDEENWHFIALDSNYITNDQLAWLSSDLETTSKPCILAFWHHPLYSSGYHGNNLGMRQFWDLLAKHKVSLVLNGHDHHYERFAKQEGIRQFIVGTGGRNLYPYVAIEEKSEFRTSDHFGFLKLELKKDSYAWKFISTDKGVVDQGSDSCATTHSR